MQSMYSISQTDWSTGHSLGESCPLQKCSQCILYTKPTGLQDIRWGSLALCRNAVNVFYIPNRLVYRTFVGGVLPSAEMQSMYSISQTDWSTGHSLGESYPLQKCSQCILYPKPTGLQDIRWGSLTLCRNAVNVFYIPNRLVYRTFVGGVLPSAEMQSMYSISQTDWSTGHSLGESYPLQKCSQCILYPKPTGLQDIRWGSLALCRNAVNVFYIPNRLVYRTFVGGVLPSAEMQSMYSISQTDWSTGHSLGESYPLQKCSQCILYPKPTGLQDIRWGSLALCRNALNVFYIPNRLVYRTFVGGVLPSAEMQSMYSISQTDWATGHSLGESYPLQKCSQCILYPKPTGLRDTRWGSLTPLQRCSRCILQSQLTGPRDTHWGSLIPLQKCSQCILYPKPTGLQDIRWGSLTLCRNAVNVLYSSSWLGCIKFTEFNLPNSLLIARGRVIEFIPFLIICKICKM